MGDFTSPGAREKEQWECTIILLRASYGCGIYQFDSYFMDLHIIIGTYIAGRGRLGNVVSGWQPFIQLKLKNFIKEGKKWILEKLAFSATKGSWRSGL